MFDLIFKNSNQRQGMTLVEVVVVVALFTLLMLVITDVTDALYRNNAYTIAQSTEIDSARRGIQIAVRDIREMTYADNGAFPLVVMDPDRIGFYSDTDQDQSVEYIEYVYTAASTTLTKNIYNATGTPRTYNLTTPDQTVTLSTYVQNALNSTSTFYYYDASGAAITNPSDLVEVRYIHTQIIVNVDPIRDPGEFLITGSSALRNLH